MSDIMHRTGMDMIQMFGSIVNISEQITHDPILKDTDDLLAIQKEANNYASDLKSTTPQAITPRIKEICREISPDSNPLFLEVPPVPKPPPQEFMDTILKKNNPFNAMLQVPKTVEAEGSTCQFGWLIWEAKWWFDCQPHMVIKKKDGTFLDITPQYGQERKVLFLPDTIRIWTKEFGEQNKLFTKRAFGVKEVKRNQGILDLIRISNRINKLKLKDCVASDWQWTLFGAGWTAEQNAEHTELQKQLFTIMRVLHQGN